MRSLFSCIGLACLCFATLSTSAFADDRLYPDIEHDEPLSETDLQNVFQGQTHQGTYNFLNRNITTFAFTELTRDNGTVRHEQGDKVDTGSWTIDGKVICYDYDDPELNQACFNIYQRGNCYYHFQISTEGQTRYGFTARSVIAGETPNCEPSLV